ncbi:hypothetical protein MUB18_20860 [Sphingobacterium sp. PCS056]|uniref:hypothetical protein n=1 Tax=Sphingobacterium sp. PCS056 TaxID=2931400 RepID=UPI00200C33DD|nr:hypothetical protein [Sphingobacterium sp. PCS056]UPZ36541.1 hypothetical protein MUB18_20860 [Sphingobacterium sp. PCS056]
MKHLDKLDELHNQSQEKIAEAISALLRSIPEKDQRVEILTQRNPPIEVLRLINKIADKKEDYETCAAIKQFANNNLSL